jgi:hypothetical protein
MPILPPDVTLLEGHWNSSSGRIEADENTRRIDELVRGHFVRLATSADGWSSLFLDREDGRFWELTYPNSGMHGGGPPRLENVSRETAESRYELLP